MYFELKNPILQQILHKNKTATYMKINFRKTKDLKINEDWKETNSILENRAVKIFLQKNFFEKIKSSLIKNYHKPLRLTIQQKNKGVRYEETSSKR